jgi:opacity protein-like surface antigen
VPPPERQEQEPHAPEEPAPPKDEYENSSLDYEANLTPLEKRSSQPSTFVLGVSWDISFPLGPSRDFVRRVDPAGLAISARLRQIVPLGPGRLGAMLDLAWHSMQEKTREPITVGNVTISGTQVHDLSMTPLVVKPYFAFGKLDQLSPYVGVGVGGAYSYKRLDIGIYRDVTESWQFVVQPEIGLEYPLGVVMALAAVKMTYLASSENGDEQLYMNFSLGLGFD